MDVCLNWIERLFDWCSNSAWMTLLVSTCICLSIVYLYLCICIQFERDSSKLGWLRCSQRLKWFVPSSDRDVESPREEPIRQNLKIQWKTIFIHVKNTIDDSYYPCKKMRTLKPGSGIFIGPNNAVSAKIWKIGLNREIYTLEFQFQFIKWNQLRIHML